MECKDHGQKRQGYGHSGNQSLHRKLFIQHHGFVPEVVMHTCDNPRCIEMTHLVAGTYSLNNKDKISKGRHTQNYPTKRVLCEEQVREIRARYNPKKDPVNGINALCREFGVSVACIYGIVQNKTYRDIK